MCKIVLVFGLSIVMFMVSVVFVLVVVGMF